MPSFKQKNPMELMTRSCFFGGCPKVINLMVFWKRPLNLSENLFHQHFRGIIVLLVGLDFHIGFIFFCSPNTPKKTWDVQRHIWQFLLGPFCFFLSKTLRTHRPLPHSRENIQRAGWLSIFFSAAPNFAFASPSKVNAISAWRQKGAAASLLHGFELCRTLISLLVGGGIPPMF